MSHKSCCACCAALGHVVEVLDALANRECSGHEGDEETGEHYEDCMRCRVDAALAHAEEADAVRYTAPWNHHSFALESLKRDNQLLAADYDGALARAQKNAQLLAGIVDWIDEHPEDPVPPSVLLIEAREAAEYAGMGRVRCAECGGIDVAPKRPGCSGVIHDNEASEISLRPAATRNVAPEQNQAVTDTEPGQGKSNGSAGKSLSHPGKSDGEGGEEARGIPENPTKSPLDSPRGVAGDTCEVGNECGRAGCPECQQ